MGVFSATGGQNFTRVCSRLFSLTAVRGFLRQAQDEARPPQGRRASAGQCLLPDALQKIKKRSSHVEAMRAKSEAWWFSEGVSCSNIRQVRSRQCCLLVGCGGSSTPDAPADAVTAETPSVPVGARQRQPATRRALSSVICMSILANSFDAYIFNVRASPDDAYRFAKGEAIQHGAGYDISACRAARSIFSLSPIMASISAWCQR